MATPVVTQPRPKANRRYLVRTVAQLTDGDVFTLDLDGNGAWYIATGIAHSDMVLVNAESGGPARIPAAAVTSCLVQVDYVRVRVAATLEIDVAAWAAEYDIFHKDVAADARKYFANYVQASLPEHLRSIVTVIRQGD